MICWIFDLDGVVTSLTEKKITNPLLLDYFAQFLQQQDLLTINTGRSLPFIREKVLTPLLDHCKEKHLPESLLHNFFAVGEKGSAWIQDEKDWYDFSTALPKEFDEKVRQLVEKEFSDTMFFDTTKQTMISLEINTGLPIEAFTPAKERLLPMLKNMLHEASLDTHFVIDASVSAIDIQHKSAGKHKGTEHILNWISQRQLSPDTFISFGDSPADLGTGQTLFDEGKNFQFIFVGGEGLITKSPSFPITYTKEHYDKGVVEFLQSIA